MATSKPISTISYNTKEFLVDKLTHLRNAHIIASWMFIQHKGEDGDKDHIHLRVVPNRRLDSMDIGEELTEYPHGDTSSKPLKCLEFRPSTEEDWILYAVHDAQYLNFKYGEDYAVHDGKIPYSWEDIVVSEGYPIEGAYLHAKAQQKKTTPNAVDRLAKGENPIRLMKEGFSPSTVAHIESAVNRYIVPQYIRDKEDAENALQELLRALAAHGITARCGLKGWQIETAPIGEQGGENDGQACEDCPHDNDSISKQTAK